MKIIVVYHIEFWLLGYLNERKRANELFKHAGLCELYAPGARARGDTQTYWPVAIVDHIAIAYP